ncbi:MAG TPA: hypothetical protein VFD39_06085 [Trueperaceae bacterium]|nr:hypothetical protein [Trueperaceae bacterium]
MRLWSRRQSTSRAKAWQAFAADLELEDGSELLGRLREHLDLGPGEIAPIYTLARPAQPQLVLFDQLRERSGPTGSVSSLRSCVLLRARAQVEFVSMRITGRLNPVLEAIEAGRTGSSRIDTARGGEFDDTVSVYARDEEGARRLLTAPAQGVLVRLLGGAGSPLDIDDSIPDTVTRSAGPPVVVIGSRDVLLTLEEPEPVAFERLTDLTADMMSLYAALLAAATAQPR